MGQQFCISSSLRAIGKTPSFKLVARSLFLVCFCTLCHSDPGYCDPSYNQVAADAGIYGSGMSGDGLANVVIGGKTVLPTYWEHQKQVFVRFKAQESGPLVTFTFFFNSADYPGYGAGTGGIWRLHLMNDDGSSDHFPVGPSLAIQDVPAMAVSVVDRKITFDSPAATIKGNLYHLVLESVDPSLDNHFSIDTWYRKSLNPGEEPNAIFSFTDWGMGYHFGGNWHNLPPNFTAIADIGYSNGKHQGFSYGEASYACPPSEPSCTNDQLIGKIAGSQRMVREHFKVSGGDKEISGLSIRLLREAGTNTDLVVTLEDSLGAEIESVTIPASSVEIGEAPKFTFPATWSDVGYTARFVSANFSSSHILKDGTEYSLKFSSSGGTYWAWVNRRFGGSFQFYSPASGFTDGNAEYSMNGGTTWQSLGRVPNVNNLQFYFKLTLPAPPPPQLAPVTPTPVNTPSNSAPAQDKVKIEIAPSAAKFVKLKKSKNKSSIITSRTYYALISGSLNQMTSLAVKMQGKKSNCVVAAFNLSSPMLVKLTRTSRMRGKISHTLRGTTGSKLASITQNFEAIKKGKSTWKCPKVVKVTTLPK